MNLTVLNSSFEVVKDLDAYKSLIWTDRYNQFGDFELFLSINAEVFNFIKEDYYLQLNNSEHLMIIEDMSVKSDFEEGNCLMVIGRSLESILDRRIIWGQKVVSGNLQEALKTLFDESIINPSITERRIENFIFKSSNDEQIKKLNVELQTNGDDLYTLIAYICAIHKIGFKVTLNESLQFVFELYNGADRSYKQEDNAYVVFSPKFENIINSNYVVSKSNYKNVTYVVGEGEGTSQKTEVVGSSAGLNRREIYTDARDIITEVNGSTITEAEYKKQLISKGKEKLLEHPIFKAFDGEVESTQLFIYGEDFYIGDIVQIANEYGNEGRAYISELIFSQSEEGLSMYPTFQTIIEEGDNNI